MAEQDTEQKVSLKDDLMVLTKVRLNVFVLVTTLFGYFLASRFYHNEWLVDGWLLIHVLIGTAAAAFGSATFNQLIEIEHDKKMKRTENRPLPSNRIPPAVAFILGWGLCGFGILHLGVKVNAAASYIAAATLITYVFIYTPMKRKTSANTLVGAIPGALPPMIGWAAVSQDVDIYGWTSVPSWFLFAILFFWQLPHFVAINWMCREDYEEAGYVMWSDGDTSGKKTARIALGFSFCLVALCLASLVMSLLSSGDTYETGWYPGMGYVVGVGGTLASLQMCRLSVKFSKEGTYQSARKLFLYTLLFLPIILTLMAIDWI